MILIGQYDSPFVRRVGIALTLYDLSFTHRPWSTFGDAEKIRPYNPLMRVPTLVLDNGEVLIESHIILDYLDSLVPAQRAMFPAREPERHRALKIAALATGLADKAVSLFYERRLHKEVSDIWVDRCRSQISTVLAVLEADRGERPATYWFGDRMSHADIAVAVVLRFLADAHPGLVSMAQFPALSAHAAARGAAGLSGDLTAIYRAASFIEQNKVELNRPSRQLPALSSRTKGVGLNTVDIGGERKNFRCRLPTFGGRGPLHRECFEMRPVMDT